MEIALMIEGQNGLTWDRWKRLARAAEGLGFPAMFRSDHFVNPEPPDFGSLETWVSLAWLASNTENIEFGTLVSPVSFRHPTVLARTAAAVDDLSGGRLVLGVGAGWQEREHVNYGFDFLPVAERLDKLEEGLEIIHHLLHSDEPFTFEGSHFEVRDAVLRPRPERPGGPPLLVAGKGMRRSLPMVAKYADHWNTLFVTAEEFARLNSRLDELLDEIGRVRGSVKRTVMLGVEIAETEAQVQRQLEAKSWATWREAGLIAGTPEQVADQLGAFAEAGAERVMLQWLDQDDMDGLELLSTVRL